MANTEIIELMCRRESILSDIELVQNDPKDPAMEHRTIRLLVKCGVCHPGSHVPCIRLCAALRDGRIIVRPQDGIETELTYVFSTLGPVTRIRVSVWRFSNPLSALYDIYCRVSHGFARMTRERSIPEISREFYVEHAALFREFSNHLQRWKECPLRV